jgi:hypothetical protein
MGGLLVGVVRAAVAVAAKRDSVDCRSAARFGPENLSIAGDRRAGCFEGERCSPARLWAGKIRI